jgi:hypothetical protein
MCLHGKGDAYLYYFGSSHGTFINKSQVTTFINIELLLYKLLLSNLDIELLL